METKQTGDTGIVLTQEERGRQRARSIAIALALGSLVVLFYALTIARLGPAVMHRMM